MSSDMFLELDGVDGESKDKTFAGKIDIFSFSWGASNSGSGGWGGGSGTGKVNVTDFSVMKKTDKSSATLAKFCANGKHIATGKVHIRKAGGDAPLEYLKYEFDEVFISSWQISDSSGGSDVASESVSLNFSKVKMTYGMQSDTGADEASPEVTINVKTNEVS